MTREQIEQWREDVALEQAILEVAFKKSNQSAPGTIDLRNEHAVIGMSVVSSLSAQSREDFVQGTLLPVLFGAAWKVFDLLVERAWQAADGPTKPTIRAKADHAVATWHRELAPLFGGDAEVAERFAHIYHATVDLRHALTHKRMQVGPGGELSVPGGGHLERAELNAVCHLALTLTDCVENGLTARSRSVVAWWLNQLNRVHALVSLKDAYSPRPIDIVLINAWREGAHWYVNTERAHTKARNANGGFPFGQLRVFFPGDEHPSVEVPLEDAPAGKKVRILPTAKAIWSD